MLRRNPRPLTCRLYCCVVLPSHTLSQTINNPFRFFYSHCISGYLYSSSSSSSPWYIVIAVDDGDRTTVDCGVGIIAWRREGRNVNRSVGWSVGGIECQTTKEMRRRKRRRSKRTSSLRRVFLSLTRPPPARSSAQRKMMDHRSSCCLLLQRTPPPPLFGPKAKEESQR